MAYSHDDVMSEGVRHTISNLRRALAHAQQERDHLKVKLDEAKQHIDTLLERLVSDT